MTDVLKLAEEALERITCLGGNLPDNRLTCRTGANDAVARGEMYCEARRSANDALATIRAARAESGWRPIAEMEEKYTDAVTCGGWTFSTSGKWTWIKDEQVHTRWYAELARYTHFYRPQLPPPPAREEVGNG